MKTAELRERSPGDLAQLEEELNRDLWKARFSNFTNQLDDTAKLRRLRREIARVKTVRTQKQTQEAKS
jgi:large subunit ribosomal protein L29